MSASLIEISAVAVLLFACLSGFQAWCAKRASRDWDTWHPPV